jgi:hypothetical protein
MLDEKYAEQYSKILSLAPLYSAIAGFVNENGVTFTPLEHVQQQRAWLQRDIF